MFRAIFHSRCIRNAIRTQQFPRVLHLVSVVFTLLLPSEVGLIAPVTLVETEPVYYVFLRLVVVGRVVWVIDTLVFRRFSAEHLKSSGFDLLKKELILPDFSL